MISLIICIETIDICVRGMVRSCRYISIRRVNEMSANYVTRLSLSVLFMNPKINGNHQNILRSRDDFLHLSLESVKCKEICRSKLCGQTFSIRIKTTIEERHLS